MSVIELIKLGHRYLKLWPERAELSQYFQEYYAITLARFVWRNFLGFSLFIVLFFTLVTGQSDLQLLVFYTIFALSMPVQVLVVLGVKADKDLPPGLSAWYKEGLARFNEKGGNLELSTGRPKYIDLAKLLNITYQSSIK
ncbi:terminus macrodomain insulation protein YfbV [Thalassotalea sp. LPB0316]|uniref:terminus macrodomain insulation protein YfbV n=1 Tax=Thalassotalea sp. LPB0316 TaxID=2769490 RepID=UPI001D04A41A|nr:terminus macrodomain insulation protein YfbV [Thalassotalea sp. LPB0316]